MFFSPCSGPSSSKHDEGARLARFNHFRVQRKRVNFKDLAFPRQVVGSSRSCPHMLAAGHINIILHGCYQEGSKHHKKTRIAPGAECYHISFDCATVFCSTSYIEGAHVAKERWAPMTIGARVPIGSMRDAVAMGMHRWFRPKQSCKVLDALRESRDDVGENLRRCRTRRLARIAARTCISGAPLRQNPAHLHVERLFVLHMWDNMSMWEGQCRSSQGKRRLTVHQIGGKRPNTRTLRGPR